MLPSFTQRWLLPRMAQWRARHLEITLAIHTLSGAGGLASARFHAALRVIVVAGAVLRPCWWTLPLHRVRAPSRPRA
ncbi:MAG: hypothetical protein MZW92_57185 [Comamonadaceae bacterium]|nr:hypothetical protein [Comamonadaceae bacterium]